MTTFFRTLSLKSSDTAAEYSVGEKKTFVTALRHHHVWSTHQEKPPQKTPSAPPIMATHKLMDPCLDFALLHLLSSPNGTRQRLRPKLSSISPSPPSLLPPYTKAPLDRFPAFLFARLVLADVVKNASRRSWSHQTVRMTLRTLSALSRLQCARSTSRAGTKGLA